jgi:prophage maintenance system killer protein
MNKKLNSLLKKADLLRIVNDLEGTHISDGESFPHLNNNHINSLLKIIESAEQTVFGKDIFPTIYQKCAHILFEICKQHTLPNGNKRCASYCIIEILLQNTTLNLEVLTSAELEIVTTLNGLLTLFATLQSKLEKTEVIQFISQYLEILVHLTHAGQFHGLIDVLMLLDSELVDQSYSIL